MAFLFAGGGGGGGCTDVLDHEFFWQAFFIPHGSLIISVRQLVMCSSNVWSTQVGSSLPHQRRKQF